MEPVGRPRFFGWTISPPGAAVAADTVTGVAVSATGAAAGGENGGTYDGIGPVAPSMMILLAGF